ncbi:SfnB family sulfur acquisition oxidoreductase [Kineosporia rhizophila]|uniref:SfnB family sulfur acquisition oxidoreductase n=1 Tax=Kineosporia TaxID=49184 RepID=UPI001E4A34E7|nr:MULTISPECIES: SfnB family sulfur acquisition oxidoreductase [Kineosporia]MCE0535326.1 SfnB family sulfur acquisition oxidoreductase [Kineosporia rhizophila]GLY16894.1 SfnB family sulfur acquisition oxidoreductase [Kineosporia sp. NBRC 101677]
MEPARLSEGEALGVLDGLLPELAEEASRRDSERVLPHAEIRKLSDAGLFALSVPDRFGGADVSVETLTEVFRRLSAVDPSIGQIPQSHYVFLEALRLQGTPAQQARFFGEVVRGARYANAQTERGGRTITEDATTLTPDGPGQYRLQGQKFYATGSLFADRLLVRAVLPERPEGPVAKAIAFVPADAPGVTIEDDWNAMGQRTTGSGTVRLENVLVPEDDVVPFTPIFDQPTYYGAFAQLLHAAIDAGVARGALNEAKQQVAKARPWFEAGGERAVDDPLLVQTAGEAEITVRGAEALLKQAAELVGVARSAPDAANTAEASVATAVAKVTAARAAVEASSVLFELGGTRSALNSLNLSRFWRDGRTHSLHDPVRWKVQHIGRWLLDDVAPPRHGQI